MSDGYLQVDLPGQSPIENVLESRVTTGFGQHEILALTVAATTRNAAVPENSPIRVVWGTRPNDIRAFYGYFNHSEFATSAGEQEMILYCVGMSKPLNSISASAYSNVTLSYIVKQTARRCGLRAVVHTSRRPLPFWAPGKDPEFAALSALATREGMRLWVSGSTMKCVDPSSVLEHNQSGRVPTYTHNDTVFNLRGIDGSQAPIDGGAASVIDVFGTDSQVGRPIKYTSATLLNDRGMALPASRRSSSRTATSLQQAREIAEANAEPTWATLKATVDSDVLPQVGALVDLQGTMPDRYRGAWLVKEVTGIVRLANRSWRCTADVVLIRNQGNEHRPTSVITSSPLFLDAGATLTNNVWESDRKEEISV